VHGEPRHQFLYNQIAGQMGYPEHRMFTMKDGIPLCMDDTTCFYGEQVPCGRVLVDNSGSMEGVPDEVLRDRFNVANDGIVVITVPVDSTAGVMAGDPLIQARAFAGPNGILDAAYDVLFDALAALSRDELKDTARVKHDASDVVRRLIQKRTGLRPLVLPIVVEV
jgi:ribonuclease J